MVFEANLSTAQQRQINASRIFLCVIYPSAITSFDDNRITQAAYDGVSDLIKSKIQRQKQQKPPNLLWDTCHDFLLLFSDTNIPLEMVFNIEKQTNVFNTDNKDNASIYTPGIDK
jgi:hypothetical protein